MRSILITGATGNVGREVIQYLRNEAVRVVAAVRNPADPPAASAVQLPNPVHFDFAAPETFAPALEGISTVFLLRPPNLADVQRYFVPLLDAMERLHVRRIVFLSVLGAEKSKLIPHRKIELEIMQRNLDYVFLRPGYFMQNMTTTLYPDIRDRRVVSLPAGDAVFNWIDAANIGEAAARVLTDFDTHAGRALDLTGSENLSFATALGRINGVLNRSIHYRPISLPRYLWQQHRRGVGFQRALAVAMITTYSVSRPRRKWVRCTPTLPENHQRHWRNSRRASARCSMNKYPSSGSQPTLRIHRCELTSG